MYRTVVSIARCRITSAIALSGCFAATRCVASVCRSTCAPFDECSTPDLLKALATSADTPDAVMPASYGNAWVTKRAEVVTLGRPCRTYLRIASRVSSGTGSSKSSPRLAPLDSEDAGPSVEVVDRQPRDVGTPEADLCEQEDDRQVPHREGLAAHQRSEESAHLLHGQRFPR